MLTLVEFEIVLHHGFHQLIISIQLFIIIVHSPLFPPIIVDDIPGISIAETIIIVVANQTSIVEAVFPQPLVSPHHQHRKSGILVVVTGAKIRVTTLAIVLLLF